MLLPPLLALHIPDGFLSLPVAAAGWAVLVVVVALALRQTRAAMGERQGPLMGVIAAFVFAAQMINFPVAGGTSGHLLGGTLVAILLGPWAAVLVMTSVVAVQALLFQDGGLLALGFNVANMGLLTAFAGYAVYQALGRRPARRLLAAGVGAWVSVMLAAAATSLELAVSGTAPLSLSLPAMLGVHALIGVGEALITVGALAFLRAARPDLLETPATPARGSGWVAVGLVIALGVAFASPLASPQPDGLERVAIDHGFDALAEAPGYELLPDYTVPLIPHETLTTMVAGALGVLVVMGVVLGVARLARRSNA